MKKYLPTFILVFFLLFFLVDPRKSSAFIWDGLILWATKVLPVTFPLFFLTSLLSSSRLFRKFLFPVTKSLSVLFGLSETGATVFLLSVLSGYPVGAKLVSENARSLSPSERKKLCYLSTTSGPAFVVGVVGTQFLRSPMLGWIIFLCHLWGVSLPCLFIKSRPLAVRPKFTPRSFSEVVQSGISATLYVGACIALFNFFTRAFETVGLFQILTMPLSGTSFRGTVASFLEGLPEMTTGCALLAPLPPILSLPLVSFLITFGGGCVLLQQLAFLRPYCKASSLFFWKALEGVVASLFALLYAVLTAL